MQISIDGLPLFKSSGDQFWPILGMLDVPQIKELFIIGLFYGRSKPSCASEFMSMLVDEVKTLEESGLLHNGMCHRISVSAVICDAPARTFVKRVKSHSGYA